MEKKKQMPVPALLLIDAVLIGIAMGVFSLFYFILPDAYQPDLSISASDGNSPAHEIVSGTEDSMEASGADDGGSKAGGALESVFTDGEIISTDTMYRSANISVTLTKYEEDGVVYYVQDIYIRNIENLKTAFAADTYGKGFREHTLDMATANHAIAAINGDYYGNSSDNGVVIRNGYLYRDSPNADVLVLFYDGTMKTYSEEEFDGNEAMESGAYQAWCFGPSLLEEDGTAITSFRSRIASSNPRTGIGYYEPGHYCFVTVDGRTDDSDGMTLAEFAELFEALGCSVAYNLDGGKTSVMVFGSEVVNNPDGGGRTSSDIIYITE